MDCAAGAGLYGRTAATFHTMRVVNVWVVCKRGYTGARLTSRACSPATSPIRAGVLTKGPHRKCLALSLQLPDDLT